jgi:hypothetical protein
MKNIPTYEEFINEGFLQDVKDFVTGVKTDDDKLAKKLLSDVDKFTDIRNGYGRHEISVNFRYEGYQFELFDGYARMHGNVYNGEPLTIKSKFLSKLFSQLRSDLNKKDTEDRLKKAQEEATLKDSEFVDVLKKNGGISGIAEIIINNIQNPRSYWTGQIRLDKNRELVMIAPINETPVGRSQINTIVVDLNTGVTRLEKSYGAYTDHKRYDGKLSNSELKSLDPYVDMAKTTAKMKDDEKIKTIQNLLKK